jgi:AmiR/NasT family two-component response regulator
MTSTIDGGAADELALLRERTAQLQHALTSRVVVDTAVGVLLERHNLARQDAFELLRRASRTHRRRIHDLAREVIDSRVDIPEIEAVIARGAGSAAPRAIA